MRLPFRRRRRSAPAQALHVLVTVLGIRARLRLARGAARTAVRGARTAVGGVRVARAVPWRPLGVAALAGLVTLAVRLVRARGGGPVSAPAAPPVPPAPSPPPGDPLLDVDGPNESAPGHHPTEAERSGPA